MKRTSMIAFILSAVVLGVSALTLEGATHYLQLHFRKEAVPLPKEIESIPSTFGPWVQVSIDQPLPEDLEHTLGTSEYIFRDYLDSRIVPADVIASYKDKPFDERRATFLEYQKQNPNAAISLMVTYYTGMVDTVAHVPDRCYVADGYDVSHADQLEWSSQGKPVDVRFLTFGDMTGVGRVNRNVAYLFQTNGKYVADPVQVRLVLQDLFAKYGYYAKIEMMTTIPDQQQAIGVMKSFLDVSLPGIVSVLPDWSQYAGKK